MNGVVTIPPRSRRVLLVETDGGVRRALAAALSSNAIVEAHARFEGARGRLEAFAPDLVVANLRLGAFNGLHLAYLIRRERFAARVLVFAEQPHRGIQRDVQQSGAFFEQTARLPVVLQSYLRAELPACDRRDPGRFDRRTLPRGGRRAWDHHMFVLVGAP